MILAVMLWHLDSAAGLKCNAIGWNLHWQGTLTKAVYTGCGAPDVKRRSRIHWEDVHIGGV